MVEILKMIVHDLNLSGPRPRLSSLPIDLNAIADVDTALDFFIKHISNNRTQSTTKRCYFDPSPANFVKQGVSRLSIEYNSHGLSNDFDRILIEESQRIVSSLRNHMEGKSRSTGSLFTLLYRQKGEHFIGLLKMDPNNGIKVNDDLTITVVKDLIPSPDEKLHKSAFIKLRNEFTGTDLHLFVLDRQQSAENTAKFFMRDFLNAHEIANDTNLTSVAEKAIKREFLRLIPADKKLSFNEKLKKTLYSGEAFDTDRDLPSLVSGFFEDDYDFGPIVQKVKDSIHAEFPDATFTFKPDPSVVKPTVFKTRNNEVVITVQNNISRGVELDWNYDDEGNFIIKINRDHLEITQTK